MNPAHRRTSALSLLLLSLAGCGGESGPRFEGSVDIVTADWAATEATDFVSATLFTVFEDQAFGAPDPYLPFAATKSFGEMSAQERALSVLRRMDRLVSSRERGTGRSLLARNEALRSAPMTSAMVCGPVHETGVDTEGNLIDTDGDYIADDYTADFGTGCTTFEVTGMYTISGKYRIRDTGTGFASYEFTATRLRTKLVINGDGDYLTNTLDGVETASFDAGAATHAMSVTWTWDDHYSFGNAKLVRNIDEESSYDPDVGSELTLGGALPAGALDFSADYELLGSGSVSDIPGNFRFDLSTPVPLHYSPACGSYLTVGTLQGLLNNDPGIGFVYEWVACAPYTLSYFGVIGAE